MSLSPAPTKVTHCLVAPDDNDLRLDRWFKTHYPQLGYGRLQKLLRSGQIRLNGGRVQASARLQTGDDLRIPPLAPPSATTLPAHGPAHKPPAHQQQPTAADIRLIRSLVLYEDDQLFVLNKPAGLAVQGGTSTRKHIDGLLGGLMRPGDSVRPRLVHRLDRDTSGLLLIARSRKMANYLGTLLKSRKADKTYLALLHGVPSQLTGEIRSALHKTRHKPQAREQMQITKTGTPGAKPAITHYQLLDTTGNAFSLAELSPKTGRTHQLRVHMSSIGHPVVGDLKYGPPPEHETNRFSRRLHLHAARLVFEDPAGKRREFTAPLPDFFRDSLTGLGLSETAAPLCQTTACTLKGKRS